MEAAPSKSGQVTLEQTDHDLLIRISERVDRIYEVTFGGGTPGLQQDVNRLNTKVMFIQWTGITAALTAISIGVRFLVGG